MRKLKRIGSSDVEDQVQQAVASVLLSGLKPSQTSIDLARAVAKGKMTTDTAIELLKMKYIY